MNKKTAHVSFPQYKLVEHKSLHYLSTPDVDKKDEASSLSCLKYKQLFLYNKLYSL